MGFPNLLCIGAQKAGTTWLHAMLSQHPGVFRAPLKEVHFFDSVHCRKDKRSARRNVKRSIRKIIRSYKENAETQDEKHLNWLRSLAVPKRIFTVDWYEQVFSGPGSEGKVAFEVTPAYSILPHEGIIDVRNVLGEVPIVYIIRDPFDRMLSQLRMSASRKFGDAPISETEWLFLYKALKERGDYKTYIPRWLSVFPENNIHFIPFKKISSEPENVMRFVESLAGLPSHDYRRLNEKRLSSKRFDVPQLMIDVLTKHVAPQYPFLEQQFGKDFVSLI